MQELVGVGAPTLVGVDGDKQPPFVPDGEIAVQNAAVEHVKIGTNVLPANTPKPGLSPSL